MSPFRLSEFTAKVQFTTSAEMPSMVYRACLKTGTVSNTAYIQEAVAERLSRDLDIPLQRILDNLPPRRNAAAHLFNPDGRHPMARTQPINVDPSGGVFRIGPANTDEQVH